MEKVHIYPQSKETYQAGKANEGVWIIKPLRPYSQRPEPLMGWTQSEDTMNQVRLEFPSQKSAEQFAKSKGWRYTVTQHNQRKVKPRNYGDNFVYEPVE